jgi:hypothetical protein
MESDSTFHPINPDTLNQTLIAIQEQIMQMQEKHDNVLRVLHSTGIIKSGNTDEPQRSPTTSEQHPVQQAVKHTGPKPATPSDFDGDRTKGRSFLNSVKWYLRSRGHEFRDLDHMVSWTLSFMKEGRALTFANQVTRQVDKQGGLPYTTWEGFWKELEQRFLPIDESEEAVNTLETDRYHQGKQTVDDYCDRFQDLVDHAGYTDGRQVVMKFRKGLEPEIADRVALLHEKRPKDDSLVDWIDAAKEIARQRVRNEAFNQVVRKDKVVPKPTNPFLFKVNPLSKFVPPSVKPNLNPNPNPVFSKTPTPSRMTAGPAIAANPKPFDAGPVPMEVDASRSKSRLPVVCHRCGQPGHFRNQCPRQYDVRFMTTEELEDCLQTQLIQRDVAIATATTEDEQEMEQEEEGEHEEDFQDDRK